MNETLISIITPSYNRATFIREAIESVIRQNHHAFEHIIVDGGSTDGTSELLEEYPHLCVICESDRGMYDAINKGINQAKGKIIGLLNTDDLYSDGAFQEVVTTFNSNPDIGAVVGGASVFNSKGENRKTIRVHSYIQPEELWKRLTIGSPVINAWFFRENVFRAIGTFKTEYSYSADRDFLLRFALSNIPWSPVKRIIYHYRQHQGSMTISHLDSRSIERAYIRKRVLGEGLDVSETLLKNFDLPPHARQYIRRWHGDMAYRLSAMSLYHRWWSLAWRAAIRGLKMNNLWPLVFVCMASNRFYKLIRERLGIDERSL